MVGSNKSCGVQVNGAQKNFVEGRENWVLQVLQEGSLSEHVLEHIAEVMDYRLWHVTRRQVQR